MTQRHWLGVPSGGQTTASRAAVSEASDGPGTAVSKLAEREVVDFERREDTQPGAAARGAAAICADSAGASTSTAVLSRCGARLRALPSHKGCRTSPWPGAANPIIQAARLLGPPRACLPRSGCTTAARQPTTSQSAA